MVKYHRRRDINLSGGPPPTLFAPYIQMYGVHTNTNMALQAHQMNYLQAMLNLHPVSLQWWIKKIEKGITKNKAGGLEGTAPRN